MNAARSILRRSKVRAFGGFLRRIRNSLREQFDRPSTANERQHVIEFRSFVSDNNNDKSEMIDIKCEKRYYVYIGRCRKEQVKKR